MAFSAGLWSRGGAWAQEATQESVKIQPYTGRPIFLDEPEQVAAPTIFNHEKIQDKYEDTGKVHTEREIARFSDNHYEADGIYREYYPNGQLFVEGQFRRGRQHGEWTFYFDNGTINRKAKFDNGKPDGPREVYRADGTLASKRGFRDGRRDGEWITYDKSGKKPLREEHYADGKPDGVWKVWSPKGQLIQQVSLKQGEREGTSLQWDENGQKRAEVNYVDNKLHGTATRWFPDGRKIVQQYDQGRLVSQSSG
ncbi:MAG: toxin-antitoxin system YwqK family antitoxin [Pirellulales bacterium]